MKALPLIAAAIAVVAAVVLAYNGLPGVAASVAVPAILLAVAALRGWLRTQLVAQVILVGELVYLGFIWPSLYFTPGALFVLPAIPIAVWCAVRHRASSLSETYLWASTLLAAVCMLCEAVFLASL